MKLSSILRLALLIVLGVAPVCAQDLASQLRIEVERLRQTAQAVPDSDTKTGLLQVLQRAQAAVDADHHYLALEELATAHIYAHSLTDEQLKLDPETGMRRFEQEFARAQTELTAADRRAHARTWKNVPQAIRAIAEISQAKTLVLMEATKPYAAATNPQNGFAYIGQARASVETSDFAASLKAVTQSRSVRRSLLPELQDLQTRVNAAFQPPRSIERHSDFIRINSSLKSAYELDAARLYAGAMYRYLEALRQFSLLDATMLDAAVLDDAAAKAAFPALVADLRQQIASSKRDDSLALLFLQKAEAYAAGRDGEPPTDDDWKNALILSDKVLPAYFAAQTAVPTRIAAKGKTITVTLVRWPYT